MSVWVMPSVDVYKNFLKRSQAVAGGGHPHILLVPNAKDICVVSCGIYHRYLPPWMPVIARGLSRQKGALQGGHEI